MAVLGGFSLKDALYGVPGKGQETVVPFPKFRTTFCTVAVAVTVTPSAVALADVGPVVCGLGPFHTHTGTPT
ncbi:hypothetical protein ACFXJJ_38825, partial [Streptomyces sp. NPDC059233]